MNNLHRELAPISAKAWLQIEEEAKRTLKRHLAGRRVVDVAASRGLEFSAVATGHTNSIQGPQDSIQACLREVQPVVELRIPFELSRQAIDDVERGSLDSDWEPLKEAARQLAFAEDRAIFDGYDAAGIQGIRQASSAPALRPPPRSRTTRRLSRRRSVSSAWPAWRGPTHWCWAATPTRPFTAAVTKDTPCFITSSVSSTVASSGHRLAGGVLLTTRGGDYSLDLGQDISIGYSSHSSAAVELYFQVTFTFRVLTDEAAIALQPAKE